MQYSTHSFHHSNRSSDPPAAAPDEDDILPPPIACPPNDPKPGPMLAGLACLIPLPQMFACDFSFSRSFIDFAGPDVGEALLELADEPSDMFQRSSKFPPDLVVVVLLGEVIDERGGGDVGVSAGLPYTEGDITVGVDEAPNEDADRPCEAGDKTVLNELKDGAWAPI